MNTDHTNPNTPPEPTPDYTPDSTPESTPDRTPEPNQEPDGTVSNLEPAEAPAPVEPMQDPTLQAQAHSPKPSSKATLATLYDGRSSRPITVAVSLGIHALYLREVNGDRLPDGLPGEWLLKKVQLEDSATPGLQIVELTTHDGLELHLTDRGLIDRLYSNTKASSTADAFARFIGKGWENVLLVVVIVIALGMIFFFQVMPMIVQRSVNLLPTSVDERVGEAILETIDLTTMDSTASEHANAYMHHMGIDTSENRVYVVNSTVMNAFALPGGHIILHSRMLDSMTRPGELAALIGHEYTHVEERHSMQAIARSVAAYAFLAALLGDVAGLSAVLLDAANSIGQLSYSRSLEAEADRKGAERLVAAGYTTHEMVSLFELLQRHQASESADKKEKKDKSGKSDKSGTDNEEKEEDSQFSEILSSHPALDKRIDEAKELGKTLKPAKSPKPELAANFKAMKASLVAKKLPAKKPTEEDIITVDSAQHQQEIKILDSAWRAEQNLTR